MKNRNEIFINERALNRWTFALARHLQTIITSTLEDIELKKKLYGMLIKMYIHECRLYKIRNREIADINIGFAVRYGINLKEKIKAVSYLLLPKLFIR